MWRCSTEPILAPEILLVDFGGQIEVARRNAARVVSRGLDVGAAPGQVDIGMMTHLLGNPAGAIDERERLPEVREEESPQEPVALDAPLRQRSRAACEFIALKLHSSFSHVSLSQFQ